MSMKEKIMGIFGKALDEAMPEDTPPAGSQDGDVAAALAAIMARLDAIEAAMKPAADGGEPPAGDQPPADGEPPAGDEPPAGAVHVAHGDRHRHRMGELLRSALLASGSAGDPGGRGVDEGGVRGFVSDPVGSGGVAPSLRR